MLMEEIRSHNSEVRRIPTPVGGAAFHTGWLIVHDLSQVLECAAVSPVLDLAVSMSRSDAARVYWVDPGAYELRLVSASSTLEDSRISRVSREFAAAAIEWLKELDRAGVLSERDAYFASFPETAASQVSSLLVFPLREEEKLAGVLTVSRRKCRRSRRTEWKCWGSWPARCW